ncbi:MAG: hypothetical protein J5J00_10760 [Deltaproteobacteria bacterium]|nr:hypothetical protein [Deltaproteobacteria bacterium]
MRKSAALLIISTLLIASPVYALSLKFQNNSSWEIHELYFSPTDEQEWGPDQLADEIIEAKGVFTLTKIPKGNYDVKIVDEDGDECVIADVNFTSSEHFVLNDKLLIGCQVQTAEDEEE